MNPLENPQMSRRALLALLGASATGALLAGCEGPGGVRDYVADPLPLPGMPVARGKSLIPDPSERYAPPPGARPAGPLGPVSPPPNTFGIIPRPYWTREGPNLRTIDPMDGVRVITFHHSGDPKPFVTSDYAETARHLELVRAYHRSRGFQDIGYHFAIDRAGRVWQLRSLKYQGQHVRYNNEHNVGVVVLGNFNVQRPTPQQEEKIKSFALLLRQQYNLDPSRVKTHQEIVSTDCPGDTLQPYIAKVRKLKLI